MADHLKTLIDSTPEMVLGGAGVVFFLIFCYGVGRLLGAFQNLRYVQAWGPLVPVVGGTVYNDTRGAADSSRLTGAFGGRPIEAEMTPGRNVGWRRFEHHRYNEFEIRVGDVSGGQDWHISFQRPLLGPAGWTITADEPLRGKLDTLGLPAAMERLGGLTLRYQAAQRRLEYRTDVTPRWALPSERFRADLESLLALAKANEEVNPA